MVTGYLLLLLFGRNGWLGQYLHSFGINIIFTLRGAVIASAVVGFPLLVRSIRIGQEGIERQYIQASRTLEAKWWDTLFTITISPCSQAILAGMTLMFTPKCGVFGPSGSGTTSRGNQCPKHAALYRPQNDETDWLIGVELDCGGNTPIAQIVPQSLEEMDIRPGSELIAVVKASAFQRLYDVGENDTTTDSNAIFP